MLSKQGSRQQFYVEGKDLLPNPLDPPLGLAVFIGDSLTDEFGYVGLMTRLGTNNTYRLSLASDTGAPTALGVADLTQLSGKVLQIRDISAGIYVQALIPDLVASLSQLSFSDKADLAQPFPAQSPKAAGQIKLKYNGPKDRTVLEIKVKV